MKYTEEQLKILEEANITFLNNQILDINSSILGSLFGDVGRHVRGNI